MTKVDLRKEYKELYRPPKGRFTVVDVPSMSFVMIDGKGDPNTSQDYREAVEALFSLAYTLKFVRKKESDQDFTVLPLEGLWWSEDMQDFAKQPKGAWQWTMMIAQPDFVTSSDFGRAREQAAARRPLPALERARWEQFHEGLCAQITYIGPYAEEASTIAGMHAFILENGYQLSGKHHKIYMSDPRRTAPEKLKTVLRQPMQRKPK